MKEGNYEWRQWKSKPDAQTFLVQTKSTGRRKADPVVGAEEFKVIFWRDSILDSDQRKIIRGKDG